jgi:hypothetical protein
MTPSAPTVARDLHSLLHPADDRDIPVPGFPSGEALTAWAQTRPRDEVVDALLDVLRNDDQPQQYAAMGVLRGLGVAITGEHVGDSVCWRVEHPTTSEQITIERDASPDRQPEGDNLMELVWLSDSVSRDVAALGKATTELRNFLAHSRSPLAWRAHRDALYKLASHQEVLTQTLTELALVAAAQLAHIAAAEDTRLRSSSSRPDS